MKNFLLVSLVIIVILLGWRQFSRESEIGAKTVVFKTKNILAQERYGTELRKITDTIFSPLSGTTPNPISNLRRISGMVASDREQGHLNQSQANLILYLCEYLERLNTERESFEAGYRRLENREFDSLASSSAERRREAVQTKKYFIEAHLRKWDEFVLCERHRVLNDLERLGALERNIAHNN